MKRLAFFARRHAALALLLLPLLACDGQDRLLPEREDLFHLDIGPMEDQLALFVFPDDAVMPRASIAMRDGFFYISDGAGRKVTRHNSFGDLLVLIFNDETNPEPSDLRIRTVEDGQMTRWAVSFPFRSPGKIAVDSRRHVFVEDILPDDQHGFDAENQALLSGVVLHFDEDGRFVDFLGQGGRGGAPFPMIAGVHASVDDEIAVVTRLSTGWDAFWFSSRGDQMFQVQIRDDAIPPPPGLDSFFATIEGAIPAPDARVLYVKVDYYREVFDPLTGTRLATELATSLVWILDIEEGVYVGFVEIPFFEQDDGAGGTVNLPFSMLGATADGAMLFKFPVPDGYAVLRVDREEQVQRRGVIGIEPGRHVFDTFHLSGDGILSALLADEWTAAVSWWRMEGFMGGIDQ